MFGILTLLLGALAIGHLIVWTTEGKPWWLRRETMIDRMVFDAINNRSFVWEVVRTNHYRCRLHNEVVVEIGRLVKTDSCDHIRVVSKSIEVYYAMVPPAWKRKVAANTIGDAFSLLKETTKQGTGT